MDPSMDTIFDVSEDESIEVITDSEDDYDSDVVDDEPPPDAVDLIAIIVQNNLKPAYAEELLKRANYQLWQAALIFNQMLNDGNIPANAFN